MSLTQTVPPTVEPVDPDEARDFLRLDHDLEYAQIARALVAARQAVEQRTGRQLINATWRLTLDTWPEIIELPRAPAQSVTVAYYATDGVLTTLSTSDYVTDLAGPVPRIAPADGLSWPALAARIGAVRVDFVAGYGATGATVPDALRHAILMLTAHLFEQREAASPVAFTRVPLGFEDLVAPYITSLL